MISTRGKQNSRRAVQLRGLTWDDPRGRGPYESGAYPLICGQIWYGCYQSEKDEQMMRPTLAFLEDAKVESPLSAPGEWYLENSGHHFVDGLFTATPTLAMLYQMTGDEKMSGTNGTAGSKRTSTTSPPPKKDR